LLKFGKELLSLLFHAFGILQVFFQNLFFDLIAQQVDFFCLKGNGFFQLVELFFQGGTAIVISEITLFLTHVTPCIFHVRDSTLIDSTDIGSEDI
jgi:hypothetical protein